MHSQQPPQPPGAPTPAAATIRWGRNNFAVWSFFCSLFGLVLVPALPINMLPAALGILLGGIGAGRAVRVRNGMGLSIAGIVLGCLGMVSMWLYLPVYEAIYDPIMAPIHARTCEKIAESYFTYLDKGQYQEAYGLFEPQFADVKSPDELKQLREPDRTLYGDYEGAAMDDKSIKYDSDGEILQINFKVNYSKKRDVLRRLVFMQNGGKWFILQDRLD